MTTTVREQIWNAIKNTPINLYALGNKPLEAYCDLFIVSDSILHFKLKQQVVLPQMEEAIRHLRLANGNALQVEQHKDFIVISSVLPE